MSAVLTRGEVCKLWKCSARTVRRAELRGWLRPVNFVGIEPVYSVEDVKAAVQRKVAATRREISRRAAAASVSAGILTVKAARRAAGVPA